MGESTEERGGEGDVELRELQATNKSETRRGAYLPEPI